MGLPSQREMFTKALAALETARWGLSDARDWLQSDWAPVGTTLPGAAGPRRI
ncbi:MULTISPECIES: hypothetical protein [Nocardia]|uniref:hypothetical protein n=1 Tax=Nocardia TaxID=1817 RepID=UPI0024539EEC|nr:MULTISPECIES: hypothetical protein [Nocardia]